MTLMLLLLACADKNVSLSDTGLAETASPGPKDEDGDGVLDGYDCDDSDASVHPGASEVWYDGVDQDCDGADDDQDGDGVARDSDCDDTDPSTRPGAGEVPGDGIDQDCDGADASLGNDADADGDGYAALAYAGPDCDDTDARVYPGATEMAGDDVDSDCDGADHDVRALAVGSLVVTEIMYDPLAVADAQGEWFEILNVSAHSVNLRGLLVADDAAFGAADIFTVDVDLVVAAGERLVFAADGDPLQNGGIPADFDYAVGGVSLNDTADQIHIGVPTGAGVTTIDSVGYDELGGWPIGMGASIELADASASASSNDRASNWCVAAARTGSASDRGSPGADSSGC